MNKLIKSTISMDLRGISTKNNAKFVSLFEQWIVLLFKLMFLRKSFLHSKFVKNYIFSSTFVILKKYKSKIPLKISFARWAYQNWNFIGIRKNKAITIRYCNGNKTLGIHLKFIMAALLNLLAEHF